MKPTTPESHTAACERLVEAGKAFVPSKPQTAPQAPESSENEAILALRELVLSLKADIEGLKASAPAQAIVDRYAAPAGAATTKARKEYDFTGMSEAKLREKFAKFLPGSPKYQACVAALQAAGVEV